MMFIHLRFAGREEVVIFDDDLVYLSDVIQKASQTYPKGSALRLYNEHGRQIRSRDVLEKARVYTLKRRPTKHRTSSR